MSDTILKQNPKLLNIYLDKLASLSNPTKEERTRFIRLFLMKNELMFS